MKSFKYDERLSIVQDSNKHGIRFSLTDGVKTKAYYYTAYAKDGSDDLADGKYPVVVNRAKSYAKTIAAGWDDLPGDM